MYDHLSHEIPMYCILRRTLLLISCMTHSWMPVYAYINGDVRLHHVQSGRLEVFYSGVWGTVCDDSFSNRDARVACRTLGYSAGDSLGNIVSPGTGKIWMDDVSCTGTESRLSYCGHNGWGINNCYHGEDVGIRCYNKVNGGWSLWYSWTSCSSSCGGGIQYRYRRCNRPVPNNGGSVCYGLPFEKQSCLTSSCRVNGGWSAWLGWSGCSSTCGTGKMYRYRHCNNPVPTNGGSVCSGLPFGTQTCISSSCRVNGGWGAWLPWSSCSTSCGNGTRYRYRHCNRPVPNNGGSYCSGSSFEQRTCPISSCRVNGGWSVWITWSSCSSTCGNGTRYRYRRCNRPVPRNGGSFCSGLPFENQMCNSTGCEVNGGWGVWLPWSSCSTSCGNGTRNRYRHCNRPVPNNGGSYCSGSSFEQRTCLISSCRVNGGWSVWLTWSSCSSTCGNGTRYRYRRCNRPVPDNGGNYCSGLPFEKQMCNSTGCEEMVGLYSTQEKERCCSLGTVAGVGAGCIVFAIITVGLFFLIRRIMNFPVSSNIYDNPGLPPRQSYENVVYTTEAEAVGDIADERPKKNCEKKKQIVYENLEI